VILQHTPKTHTYPQDPPFTGGSPLLAFALAHSTMYPSYIYYQQKNHPSWCSWWWWCWCSNDQRGTVPALLHYTSIAFDRCQMVLSLELYTSI